MQPHLAVIIRCSLVVDVHFRTEYCRRKRAATARPTTTCTATTHRYMQKRCLSSLNRVGARGVAVAAAAGKARGRKMARNKSTARSSAEAEARPAIVAFDLDGTLWCEAASYLERCVPAAF